jgi:hypothetical protein
MHVLPDLPWAAQCMSRSRQAKPILKEQDAFPIHVLRIVLEASGLLEEEDGLIDVTEHGAWLLDDDRVGMLYCVVFWAFFQEISLAELDGLSSCESLQETIGYSLFGLSSLSSKWYALDKLVDRILTDVAKWDLEILQPKKREAVLWARLFEPLLGFGLLESRGQSGKKGKPAQLRFRKTPLVEQFLTFLFD